MKLLLRSGFQKQGFPCPFSYAFQILHNEDNLYNRKRINFAQPKKPLNLNSSLNQNKLFIPYTKVQHPPPILLELHTKDLKPAQHFAQRNYQSSSTYPKLSAIHNISHSSRKEQASQPPKSHFLLYKACSPRKSYITHPS